MRASLFMRYAKCSYLIAMAMATALLGCDRKTEYYSFDIRSVTGSSGVTVKFSDGSAWPVGAAGIGKTVNDIPGPMPDTAEITWTDNNGAGHKQTVQITPLPPPTTTSTVGAGAYAVRMIYFVIQADNTVKVMYHDPHFTQ